MVIGEFFHPKEFWSSSLFSVASALEGAIKNILSFGFTISSFNINNSAKRLFPPPVGMVINSISLVNALCMIIASYWVGKRKGLFLLIL